MTEGLEDEYEFCGRISFYMNPAGNLRISYNLDEQMTRVSAMETLAECVKEIRAKARNRRTVEVRQRKRSLEDSASP